MANWITVIIGMFIINGVMSHETGAPPQACANMTPSHLTFGPSLYPPPFTISVNLEKFVVGEPVTGESMLLAGMCNCILV